MHLRKWSVGLAVLAVLALLIFLLLDMRGPLLPGYRIETRPAGADGGGHRPGDQHSRARRWAARSPARCSSGACRKAMWSSPATCWWCCVR